MYFVWFLLTSGIITGLNYTLKQCHTPTYQNTVKLYYKSCHSFIYKNACKDKSNTWHKFVPINTHKNVFHRFLHYKECIGANIMFLHNWLNL